MRLVIVESPFAGDVERNLRYVRAAMRDCLLRGEAPIASHALYTQPGVLDDGVPSERQHGIDAGLAWGRVADLTAVYNDLGESRGMRYGVAKAVAAGRAIEYRSLPEWAPTAPQAPHTTPQSDPNTPALVTCDRGIFPHRPGESHRAACLNPRPVAPPPARCVGIRWQDGIGLVPCDNPLPCAEHTPPVGGKPQLTDRVAANAEGIERRTRELTDEMFTEANACINTIRAALAKYDGEEPEDRQDVGDKPQEEVRPDWCPVVAAEIARATHRHPDDAEVTVCDVCGNAAAGIEHYRQCYVGYLAMALKYASKAAKTLPAVEPTPEHPEDRAAEVDGERYGAAHAAEFCAVRQAELVQMIAIYPDSKAEEIFERLREEFWARVWKPSPKATP